MSFAVTPARDGTRQLDAQHLGHGQANRPRDNALAMSVVPTPKATHPRAPLCGVWESVPTMSWPGSA